VGLARLPHAVNADCADSDACIVVLMARHTVRGELSPYFWGQRYMGALEPTLLALLAPFGLATPAGGAIVGICLALAQTALVWKLAERAGAPRCHAALLFAIPSTLGGFHQTILYGARHAATLLGLWVLLRALAPERGRKWSWWLTGVLSGLAFYGDHLMVMFVVPAFIAAWRQRRLGRALAGFLPFVVVDSVLAATVAAGRYSLPQEPKRWVEGVEVLGTTLVRLLGADAFLSGTATVISLIAACIGAAAFAHLLLVAARRDGAWRGPFAYQLMLVTLALCLLATAAVALDDQAGIRYLVPGLGPLSVVLARAGSHLPRWPSAALVAALLLPRLTSSAPRSAVASERKCRAEVADLVGTLDAAKVQGVWADYWDAFRIAVASEERWPVGITNRRHRYPKWAAQARSAHPVAYVVPTNDLELRARIEHLVPHARWLAAKGRLIAVVPQTLPGLAGVD